MNIGRRGRPNEIIVRDPNLLCGDASSITSYPGGHDEGFADTTKHMLNEVYDYILNGDMNVSPKYPTFQDGYCQVVLCEAIVASARTGKWVEIGLG